MRTSVVWLGLLLAAYAVAVSAQSAPAPSENEKAQETPNTSPNTSIDEVILVTASRVQTTADKAPIPVFVYTTEDIKQRQAVFLDDILRGTPGVHIARSGGVGGIAELRMRGGEANHTKVHLDGIAINDPALSSQIDLSLLSVAGLKQVELLYGAQSGVWGSDAISGVINLNTTPAAGERVSKLSLAAGSFDTKLLSGEWTRDSKKQTTSARRYINANFSRFATDGTNFSQSGDEEDGYRNNAAHLNVGYLTTAASLRVILGYTNAKSEYDSTFGRLQDSNHVAAVNQLYGGIHLGITPSPRWTHSIHLTYLDTTNRYRNEGVTLNLYAGTRTKLAGQVDYNHRHLATGAHHRLTLAAEYATDDYRQRASSPIGDPNYSAYYRRTSIVGEYSLALASVVAAISVRTDNSNAFRNSAAYRASVKYRPHTTTALSATLATGIKNPTFVERFGFFPDRFVGNPRLEPEQSRSFMLDIEQRIGSKTTLRIGWFRTRLNNEINGFVCTAAFATCTAANEDSASHRQGVDLTARIGLSSWARLMLVYSRLDAKQADATGQSTRELRRPKHSATLLLDVQRQTFSGQLGWIFTGTRYDDDFTSGAAQRVRLADYGLLHFVFRVELNKHTALHFKLNNALDTSYEDVYLYRSVGRQLLAGVDISL